MHVSDALAPRRTLGTLPDLGAVMDVFLFLCALTRDGTWIARMTGREEADGKEEERRGRGEREEKESLSQIHLNTIGTGITTTPHALLTWSHLQQSSSVTCSSNGKQQQQRSRHAQETDPASCSTHMQATYAQVIVRNLVRNLKTIRRLLC